MNGTGQGAPVQGEQLLTATEVSVMFRVDPRTVARWGHENRLIPVLAPGWRYPRYREAEVRAFLDRPGTA